MEKFLQASEDMNERIDNAIESLYKKIPTIACIGIVGIYSVVFYLFVTRW